MSTIAEARAYLLRVKTDLERPDRFYREHYLYWRDLARQVAEATLVRVQPPHVSDEAWTVAIANAMETLIAQLLEADGMVGATIWMLRSIEPSAPGALPYPSPVPFESIVDWVAAGRAGEDGGKHLRLGAGEMDSHPDGSPKSDREVAWRVFHAIRLNKNPRLLGSIQQWMDVAGDPQVLQAMDAVQTAWDEFFTVQCAEDWTRWVAAVIRE